MPRVSTLLLATSLSAFGLPAFAQTNDSTPVGYGPSPQLPKPAESGWVPTVNIAPASSWKDGQTPKAAEGLQVKAFAQGLDHPRQLFVLPNGDVLVAETNKPEGSGGRSGIEGWVMGMVMKRAGAGVKSADRITLLRDADGDGTAEVTKVFAKGLHSPYGMALVKDTFYVANADAIVSFSYKEGDTELAGGPKKVADLPGVINHHWTKILSPAKTEPSSTRRSARTATSARMALRRKKTGRRSWKSILRPAQRAYLHQAFAIRSEWPGSLKRVRSGLP